MTISGHTKVFAVLGNPIGHSLSPVMHNAAIAEMGMDAVYLAFNVAPEHLMVVLGGMARMGFGGVNLTIPLKQVAFDGISDLDKGARLLGAVNTVAFQPGGLKGYNTDGLGFLDALQEAFGKSPAGLSVCVLGAGGAGRAVALTCASAGAAEVVVADIDLERAKRVVGEITGAGGTTVARAATDEGAIEETVRTAGLVVQATPVGMKADDASVLATSAFTPGQLVFDLVYMFPETAFMKAAAAAGARTVNGLGMLLRQGARSLSIWTNSTPPIDVMRAALEEAVYGRVGGLRMALEADRKKQAG